MNKDKKELILVGAVIYIIAIVLFYFLAPIIASFGKLGQQTEPIFYGLVMFSTVNMTIMFCSFFIKKPSNDKLKREGE